MALRIKFILCPPALHRCLLPVRTLPPTTPCLPFGATSEWKKKIFASVPHRHCNPYQLCNQLAGSKQALTYVGFQSVVTGFSTIALPCESDEECIKDSCEDGRVGEMLPRQRAYVKILQNCIWERNLAEGKRFHAQLIKSGAKPSVDLYNTLLNMYITCGSLMDARQLFDQIPKRDACLWATLIAGYVNHGHYVQALKLFNNMERDGAEPSKHVFRSILRACSRPGVLEQGKQIHARIIATGLDSDIDVGNSLIAMYYKCGSMEHARQVFVKMPKRNVDSWNMMIVGYARYCMGDEALKCFWKMQQEGLKLDEVTFTSTLKACAILRDQDMGQRIHAHIMKTGVKFGLFVWNALVDMYATCGSMECARQVFDTMPGHNLDSWNAMITGYVQHGQGEEALKYFKQMQQGGVKPDKITFTRILKACAIVGILEQAQQMHAYLVRSGFNFRVSVWNSLVDMYVKCGSVEHGCKVFDKMPKRDVVTWNIIMSALYQHGYSKEVLKCFWRMQQEGLKPGRSTFISTLKACANLGALEQGQQIHALVVKCGYESDVIVGTTLLNMYAKGRSIECAWQVFKKIPKQDAVTWSIMISGFACVGKHEMVLECFWQMQRDGVEPDGSTFVTMFNTCGSLAALKQGKQIHALLIKTRFELDICVWNSLIAMYNSCERIDYARQVFDNMPERNVCSWNLMIASYAKGMHGKEVFKLFRQMTLDGVKANGFTFLGILNACATLGALEEGKQVHAHIIKIGLKVTLCLRMALIEMYTKCGSKELAQQVLNEFSNQDLVS